ncbi:MAG: undecaprenyl/decaprenyl-phosphate alpha-N-acetylglucosaminyl 1-phosphate transferase [Pseudomonadales bacterium]|nr:undecaprenyl/decaprenyl-phosphate alpha-N-acetylglucosaminyl 1-phosphate transferase [Pseudomonadales bacterium]
MAFYAALILSMIVTLVLIPPLMRYAGVIGAVDEPNSRKVHVKAIPRIGGIAMILGSLIPLIIWLPLQKEYISIATAVAIIFVFGLWDDRKDLSYKYKFLGQFLAAATVVYAGDIYIRYAPFMGDTQIPSYIACPFTILCLVAITNAMNLADGLDGLAGGTTLLSFGLVGVLCLTSGAPYILIVTMAVVGGVLGFLRFNSHPASIFMGDTGSQFLGLILGVELLLLTQQADIMLSKALPLLILGLPLVDTITVMGNRILSGKSPFSPDKNHLHHRLLKLGFSHYETVVILYLTQALFVVSAFFTAYSPDWIPASLFIGYSVTIVLMLSLLESRRYSFQERGVIRVYIKERVQFLSDWLQSKKLYIYLPGFIVFAMPVLSFYTVLSGNAIGADVAILCAAFALAFFARNHIDFNNDWFDRVITYTFCACLSYLGYYKLDVTDTGYIIEWAVICVAALLVFVAISTSNSKKFETSPYDILLILLAFLIPHFSQAATDIDHLPLDIVKFIVLLYVFEYLINSHIYQSSKTIRLSLGVSAAMIPAAFLI